MQFVSCTKYDPCRCSHTRENHGRIHTECFECDCQEFVIKRSDLKAESSLPNPGPRSKWIDVTEAHSDAFLRQQDRLGKVIWDQKIPVKVMVRKEKHENQI